jgi:hypothetical protein
MTGTKFPPGYESAEEEYRACGEREVAELCVRDFGRNYRVIFCSGCDNVYIAFSKELVTCSVCGRRQ